MNKLSEAQNWYNEVKTNPRSTPQQIIAAADLLREAEAEDRFERVMTDTANHLNGVLVLDYQKYTTKLALVLSIADQNSAVGEVGITFYAGNKPAIAEGDDIVGVLGVPDAYIYNGRLRNGSINTVGLKLPVAWRMIDRQSAR